MKVQQPIQPILRGVLAAALIGGALVAVPSAPRAQAQDVGLRSHANSIRPWHISATAMAQHARSPRLFATAGPVMLMPPRAIHAPHLFRASPAGFFVPRHIFNMGLATPTHDLVSGASRSAATTGAPAIGDSAVPLSVDLSGDAPPVGNQGPVNSCASWATGYTLLGWYAHHYRVAGAPYAPMYVYSELVQGVNKGTSFEGNFGIEQQGIDTQADYVQGNYDYTNLPTAAEQENASHYHSTGYTQIYAQGAGSAQQAIENAMAAGKPVAVGIPVYSNFMNATASAPLVDVPPAGAPLYGGHAIVAMKYDANGLWIENQWGTSWGLSGWGELSWSFVNRYLFAAYTISGFQGQV